jgi:hypothetical protein
VCLWTANSGLGPLFRTVGRDGKLTCNALHRVNAFELVRKRAAAAGIKTPMVGRHAGRSADVADSSSRLLAFGVLLQSSILSALCNNKLSVLNMLYVANVVRKQIL